MNVQLKEGQTYPNSENDFTYAVGFGRIRNMNFVIISGQMADPENFKAQATANIWFYANQTAAIEGKQPLYTVDISLQDAEIINILNIDENGYSISEKKLYDYFLTMENNAELFEFV